MLFFWCQSFQEEREGLWITTSVGEVGTDRCFRGVNHKRQLGTGIGVSQCCSIIGTYLKSLKCSKLFALILNRAILSSWGCFQKDLMRYKSNSLLTFFRLGLDNLIGFAPILMLSAFHPFFHPLMQMVPVA